MEGTGSVTGAHRLLPNHRFWTHTQQMICSVQKGKTEKDPLLKSLELFQETKSDGPWPGGISVGRRGLQGSCVQPQRELTWTQARVHSPFLSVNGG